MDKKKFAWDVFYTVPIIGIIRGLSIEVIKNILPVYQEAGLNSIEITMNTDNATAIIQYIRKEYPMLNAGAGTVCNEKDLALAMDAGAQFIVTPVTDKNVIKRAVRKKMPVFAGAFTPTEIYKAWEMGAAMVKLYPAKTLGAAYVKDIKAPLNKIKLLPAGGIGLDDIVAYRQAGADGFGIGGPLFLKELVEEKNWSGLRDHFKKFVDKVHGNL